MMRALALAAFLSGCASAPAHDDPPPRLPPVPASVPEVVRTVPKPPATIATLTAPEIVVAANQAHRDATGYVAWSNSKPENIDRLTTLTSTLDAAVARMKAGRADGQYKPTDVVAARAALRELRSFLKNKGD